MLRRQQPGFGKGIASEDDLDEAARAIAKALPWLSRKRLDEACAAVAAERDSDLVAFCDRVKRVATRAALLLSDDLPGALELVRAQSKLPTAGDPLARDLLQLWASELAVRHRQRANAG